MDSHTRGTWVSMDGCEGGFGDAVIAIIDDSTSPVALPPAPPDGENWTADSRLIAAAPALLAACEAMMAAFEEPGNPVLYTGPMLAAIAKAKGEV
jgi:hypothetical protein